MCQQPNIICYFQLFNIQILKLFAIIINNRFKGTDYSVHRYLILFISYKLSGVLYWICHLPINLKYHLYHVLNSYLCLGFLSYYCCCKFIVTDFSQVLITHFYIFHLHAWLPFPFPQGISFELHYSSTLLSKPSCYFLNPLFIYKIRLPGWFSTTSLHQVFKAAVTKYQKLSGL